LPESHATLCNVIRRGFDQLEGRAEQSAPPVPQKRRRGRPSKERAAYERYCAHAEAHRFEPDPFEVFLEDPIMRNLFDKPLAEPALPTPARAAYLRATVPQPVEPETVSDDEEHETKSDASLSPDTYRRLFDIAFGVRK
jgi:hypothetical protein